LSCSNHLHFITSSTYHRVQLFHSNRFRQNFLDTLEELRIHFSFRIIGYVLMPEHFHVLTWPSPEADPSRILKTLKPRTARFMLRSLPKGGAHHWCRRMLTRFALPVTVHDESRFRVGQRRFYDMNVGSGKKQMEKRNYMHGNPVERRLVSSPELWPWSSFRFYNLGDESIPQDGSAAMMQQAL
ncbi:MAG: transposase, partial [Candidatus Micrarchaeaceae archaeon]